MFKSDSKILLSICLSLYLTLHQDFVESFSLGGLGNLLHAGGSNSPLTQGITNWGKNLFHAAKNGANDAFGAGQSGWHAAQDDWANRRRPNGVNQPPIDDGGQQNQQPQQSGGGFSLGNLKNGLLNGFHGAGNLANQALHSNTLQNAMGKARGAWHGLLNRFQNNNAGGGGLNQQPLDNNNIVDPNQSIGDQTGGNNMIPQHGDNGVSVPNTGGIGGGTFGNSIRNQWHNAQNLAGQAWNSQSVQNALGKAKNTWNGLSSWFHRGNGNNQNGLAPNNNQQNLPSSGDAINNDPLNNDLNNGGMNGNGQILQPSPNQGTQTNGLFNFRNRLRDAQSLARNMWNSGNVQGALGKAKGYWNTAKNGGLNGFHRAQSMASGAWRSPQVQGYLGKVNNYWNGIRGRLGNWWNKRRNNGQNGGVVGPADPTNPNGGTVPGDPGSLSPLSDPNQSIADNDPGNPIGDNGVGGDNPIGVGGDLNQDPSSPDYQQQQQQDPNDPLSQNVDPNQAAQQDPLDINYQDPNDQVSGVDNNQQNPVDYQDPSQDQIDPNQQQQQPLIDPNDPDNTQQDANQDLTFATNNGANQMNQNVPIPNNPINGDSIGDSFTDMNNGPFQQQQQPFDNMNNNNFNQWGTMGNNNNNGLTPIQNAGSNTLFAPSNNINAFGSTGGGGILYNPRRRGFNRRNRMLSFRNQMPPSSSADYFDDIQGNQFQQQPPTNYFDNTDGVNAPLRYYGGDNVAGMFPLGTVNRLGANNGGVGAMGLTGLRYSNPLAKQSDINGAIDGEFEWEYRDPLGLRNALGIRGPLRSKMISNNGGALEEQARIAAV